MRLREYIQKSGKNGDERTSFFSKDREWLDKKSVCGAKTKLRKKMAYRCATIISMRLIVRLFVQQRSLGLLLALCCVSETAIAREPFQLREADIPSLRSITDALRGNDPTTSIPAYLEGAQCGGWDKETDVGGFMAQVWGVPGRRYDWAGDIRSGMGKRIDADGNDNPDDDYEFPDTAQGLATACEQGRDRDWKQVWRPVNDWVTIDGETVTEYAQGWHEFAYPYFEDPSCRWRIDTGAWPPEPLNEDEFFNFNKDGWEHEAAESCTNFCDYLNSFYYRDCLDIVPRDIEIDDGTDDDGNIRTRWETINTCNREGMRYICTDQEVEEGDRAAACREPDPEIEEWANARKCVEQQCRCPNAEDPAACVKVNGDGTEYQSYYRLYDDAGYSRNALTQHVSQDDAEKNFQTTCFGFYNEFDPKNHRTNDADRRCVINIAVEDMRESQQGKATYREGNVVDKNPTDLQNQRPGGTNNTPGTFDVETDTWYQKLGSAFSFINEQLFNERYKGDLGNVYRAYNEFDNGVQRATPQISDSELFAESNLMRAFDDTGNPRAYVRWWQEQQSRMAALLRSPLIHIVLPNAWFMNIDPSDPFLTPQTQTDIAAVRANRSDTVELQIEADDDALGLALAYLERSMLLHIEEEPISIIVPMGSPVEFRARAADWCNWYKNEHAVTTCDDAPQDIIDIMNRLEEYATRIDDYRTLRAELSLTAGAVLDLQHRLMEPVAQWFIENKEQLNGLIDNRERTEQELLPLWQDARRSLTELHEQSNLPWCMNQRFTSTLFSLPPFDGNASASPTGELALPALPLLPQVEDIILDFSTVSTITDTLKIPVLKPVQIRIEIPTPPTPGPLAPLPPIDDLRNAMMNAIGSMPTVENTLSSSTLPSPPTAVSGDTIEQARTALTAMTDVLQKMNERYEKFWKSIGPIKPGEEQFDRQIELKTEMKCSNFNDLPCEHVEMDLLERGQRIGSRPLVLLSQDFHSVGTTRFEPTVCLAEDDACHILHAERTNPDVRWEIRGTSANNLAIDDLKIRILRLTQPPPLGTLDPLLLRPYENDPSPLQSFPSIRLTP